MFAPQSYLTTLEYLPTRDDLPPLAERIYTQVFRTDFTAPGFALVRFRPDVASLPLRRFMVLLKDALSAVHQRKNGLSLSGVSMMRFDQQTTTKFHLDGGPDESYLLLGYEPSRVQSRLQTADYLRAAHDLNLTPLQYLADYNPLSARGEQQLASFITPIAGFAAEQAQVLVINNSRLPFAGDKANTLGVLHQATVLTPDPHETRIVNSMLLTASESAEAATAFSLAMQEDFLSSTPV